MAYTVKELSTLSGVTVRTLHYYEEVNLLKPAYYGSNGYRYYEEKELLMLQQILFFKELGLTLKQIHKALENGDFNFLSALCSHRHRLIEQRKKIDTLVNTIDQTLKYLKGKKKMKNRDFFDGFTLVTQATKEVPYYEAEELVLSHLKDQPSLSALEKQKIAENGYHLLETIAQCMEEGKSAGSKEVQSLIQKHYMFAKQFHHLTAEVYQALAKLYVEHPQFRQQLDSVHPNLAEFMRKAMHQFASKR